MKTILNVVVITILLVLITSCSNESNTNRINNKLVIFHAGSLTVPFKQITEEFIKENPSVEIFLESAGSVACARKITDLNKECDIMASADYTVINEMLIPEHTDWNIKFASNEMAIAYHHDSKYSKEICQDNWHEILLKGDVEFGRSDPNSDPCGYRAVLVSLLAEKFYDIEGLSAKLIAKDNEYIRPKETDLLALLETNTIDYIFLYRSVAEQHGLNFVLLPDSINLKRPEIREFYTNVSVEINGKKPGEMVTKIGQPMLYGITMLKNAPKELATKFLQFVLSSDKGMRIMTQNGQPSMVPSCSETFNSIPQELKHFAKENGAI